MALIIALGPAGELIRLPGDALSEYAGPDGVVGDSSSSIVSEGASG